MPRISVVIPMYNKGPYIVRAIDSVLKQTFEDLEVIVVDDGSSDDGPAQVAACADKRVSLISQANAGPGAARNTGLAAAKGELVGFLDADDEYYPDFLQTAAEFLDANPACVSVTAGLAHDSDAQPTSEWARTRGVNGGVFSAAADTDAMLASYVVAYMSPCSTLARADVLRSYGGFCAEDRCRYGEDQYLFLQVMLNHPVGVILEPHGIYHTEASSLAFNRTEPHPVEPYLLNPEPIFRNCPPGKRELLDKILEIRAVWSAQHYALHADLPDYARARFLLSKYRAVGGVSPSQRRYVELWARAPWLARTLRAAKRLVRRGSEVTGQTQP